MSRIRFVTNGGTPILNIEGPAGRDLRDLSGAVNEFYAFPSTTRTGYTGPAWYSNPDFTGNPMSGLPHTMPEGTTTYYAS